MEETLLKEQNKNETRMVLLGIVVICVVGFTCGLAMPPSNSDSYPWNWVSSTIGWFYFACWSISFYPQAIINFRRKSVVGLSFDYQTLNIIGFSAYSTFNCAFYYDPGIQAEYQSLHNGKSNQVQASDVFFSLHAVLMTIVILIQIAIYERGKQKVSRLTVGLIIAILVLTFIYLMICIAKPTDSNMWSWLYFMYYLSGVKIGITLVKYTPQALLNYWRKSTVGCNIHNFLLDFAGGSLSIVQLCMDAWLTGDWGAVTGDLPKFILGTMSMVYDTIFFVQHYWLYTSRFDSALQKSTGDEAGDVSNLNPSLESAFVDSSANDIDTRPADDDDEYVEEGTQYASGQRTVRSRNNSSGDSSGQSKTYQHAYVGPHNETGQVSPINGKHG